MAPILRALSAAALAAGQAALTVTENGTYLATVTLDSVPVKLLVDLYETGVWVKCSALEGPSCADGITTTTSGYSKARLERFDKNVPRKTRRFKEVIIAGQTFNGFDGYVVYDALPQADPTIQGVLGLKKRSKDYDQASMYLDSQVATVALQLGQSSSDSKLSLDTLDRALVTKKGTTTAVTAGTEMKCFQVPLANGSNECTYSAGNVFYDPALPYIGLYSTTFDTFERRYLYTCTALGSTYSTTGYACDASVKLPRLTMQIGSWEFFLDPSEYTVPIAGSSQIKVLAGDYPYMYSGWVMGAPFLRKYPFVYNTSGSNTIYCVENTTCTSILPKSTTRSPSYSGGGGYSGSGGYSGGGGSSPSYDVDVETKRKRNKIYLTIGLSVAGIAVLALCGCIFKCGQSKDGEEEGQDDSKTKDHPAVQLPVGAAGGDSDDSDGDSRKKSKGTVVKTTSDKSKAASKRRKESELSSSSDDASDVSSSYDSDSSEERRRERRRRRRRRRARRRERELRQQTLEQRPSGATEVTTATTSTGDDNSEETPYVAALSPKNASGVQ